MFLADITDAHPRHHQRCSELRKDAAVTRSATAALDLVLQETGKFIILALKK